MCSGKTLFAQLMASVPGTNLWRVVTRHGSDAVVRSLGHRSGKEIADVIEADKVWCKVLGSRVPQIELPRLVFILAEVGIDPLL